MCTLSLQALAQGLSWAFVSVSQGINTIQMKCTILLEQENGTHQNLDSATKVGQAAVVQPTVRSQHP